MKTDPPGALSAAFAVIRDTDPATYERMERSGWTVHVLTSDHWQFLTDHKLGMPPQVAMEIMSGYDDGVTNPAGTYSVVSDAGVKRDARHYHVPAAAYMASTLVHEFQHSKFSTSPRTGEDGAFAAELEFDSRLGNANLTRSTLEVEANETGQ